MQGDRAPADDSAPGIIVGNGRDAGDAEPLDQAFIGAKEKCPIALQRAAEHGAELMSREVGLRQRWRIEKVSGIERRVAMKLE